MGKSSTPPPPDYAGAAQQQAASSKELTTIQNWANRPDQYTPWGSVTWGAQAAVDPSTGQPITRFSQQQQLNPQLQQALNDQIALQQQRSQLAGSFQQRVGEDYSQPFNWTNLPGVMQGPQAQLTGTYDLRQNLPMQNLDLSRQGMQGVQSSVPGQSLDLSAPMQTTYGTNEPAFAAERRRIEEGLFQRMRPEQQRQEDATRTMLANQGFTMGSEGYNRELQRLQEQQANERYNALQMGGAEQQRLQQMMLGQQQQAFGQDVTSQQAQNAAQQAQFGIGLQQGQFYNQAMQQRFAQEAAARQAQQQAQLAQFGMGQQAGQFYNQASQNMFGMEQGANAQNFQQLQAQSDYQNRLRQQAIAEQAMARGMSLNEMNALLSGQQVSTPQMPAFMTAQGAQPYQGLAAAHALGQYNTAAAQAEAQANSGLWGGLGSMIGSGAALYALGAFSDARLKSNIVRVGTHPRGIGVYEYDIMGRRERGVMAQELLAVAPELVGIRDGFLTVDYGGL